MTQISLYVYMHKRARNEGGVRFCGPEGASGVKVCKRPLLWVDWLVKAGLKKDENMGCQRGCSMYPSAYTEAVKMLAGDFAAGEGRCSTERKRFGLQKGFSVVEILVVVVIIAIAAIMVVPMFSSAGSVQVKSAANIIAADMEYAKSMAITRGQNYSVVFDKTAESYRIADQDGNTISHPVKKGFSYVMNFRSDSRLSRVDISNVDFQPGASDTITFDYIGSPYSGQGVTNPLNSGQIRVEADGVTATISVEPVTGFISITN